MSTGVILSLLAAFALPALAEAQSLASIAQAGRRSSRPARTYTDADLRAARGRVSFAAATEFAEAPSLLGGIPDLGFGALEPPVRAAGEERVDERSQRRSELQRQVDAQVKVIGVVQRAMADAQSELNDLTQLTFGNGRRAQLIQLVEDGQRELALAEQAIAGLEDQARRNGFVVSR